MKDGMKRTLVVMITITVLLVAMLVYYAFKDSGSDSWFSFQDVSEQAEFVPYKDFVKDAQDGKVVSLYYCTSEEKMIFTYNGADLDESDNMGDFRSTLYPSGESFRENMLEYGIDVIRVKEDTTADAFVGVLGMIFPILILLMMMFSLTKSIGIANSFKKEDLIQKSTVRLDDIIGIDEIKDELKLIVRLIQDGSYGEKLGARMPHGILLSGDPGVGKTMIAKAISNESGVPLLSVNGSDFVEIFAGNGPRHVRQLFSIARSEAPCIIFIDEFDAIGEARDSWKESSEDSKTINALLKEMDGFKELENVFVLAATNHPEKLDKAIIRAGRFDREVRIMPPRDWEVRKELFVKYLKDKPLSDDVDLDVIAKIVPGFTGADIMTVCNESSIVALSHGLDYITHGCIEEAIDKKLFKGSRAKKANSDFDKRVVAGHEAGHALMSYLLRVPIARISTQSTTSGVGGVVFNEDSPNKFILKSEMENNVKILYAGRAAELILYGDCTNGASNDFEKATKLITEYVCTYCFDNCMPPIVYNDGKKLPDKVAERRNDIAKSLYKDTVDMIKENKEMLKLLTDKLLDCQAMSGADATEFLNSISEVGNDDFGEGTEFTNGCLVR